MKYLILGIVAALLAGIGACVLIEEATEKQSPTVTFSDGPALLLEGEIATYKVKLEYPEIMSLSAPVTVEVQIWEDDTWPYDNQLLDNVVRVSIPPGRKSGEAPFTLTCSADSRRLEGDDGSSEAESMFHVFARVSRQDESGAADSDNIEIECLPPADASEKSHARRWADPPRTFRASTAGWMIR